MKKWIAALMLVCLFLLFAATAEEIQLDSDFEAHVSVEGIDLDLGVEIEDSIYEEAGELDLGEGLLPGGGETTALSQAQDAVDAVQNTSGVAIDEKNFPDGSFLKYVIDNWDTDGDRILSEEEINTVTYINVNSLDIYSLKGIEYFSEVETLCCSDNHLTNLDLTECEKLESLYCESNKLNSLNVQNCTALKLLYCGTNYVYSGNQLASLDLSNCTALTDIICSDNKLKKLDLSNCTALKHLECDQNELTELIVNRCAALESLSCFENKLKGLNVSACTELVYIQCGSNQLTRLDVSQCRNLRELRCYSNQLTELNVTNCNALEKLDCDNNKLTNLDLNQCASLTEFKCCGNQLTNLDMSGCIKLETLNCGADRLLSFQGNRLTSLDVSQCRSLTGLYCDDNQLTKLDVSKCTKLEYLCCENNQLTALDVSKCSKLKKAVQEGSYTDEGYSRYEYSPSNYSYVVSCDHDVVITPKPAKAQIAACTVAVKDAVYTGKAQKPAMTVKYGTAQLKAGKDYTVSYKNNKAVGTATVIIKGKGSYVGNKSVAFKINPKAVTGLKLNAGKKKLTVSWKTVEDVTGYQLQYGLKKDFSSSTDVTVSKAATNKKTLKNLKKGKTYYVRIRAYKTIEGNTYWSAWSSAKKAKVK